MHRRLESRLGIMAVVALTLWIAAAPPVWAGPEGGSPAPTSDAERTTSAPAASSAQPANAAPPAELASELEQLRTSVEAQAKRFEQDSEELASERASLKAALDQIAALEAKLGVSPEAAPAAAPSDAVTAYGNAAPLAFNASSTSADQQTQAQTPTDLSNRIGNLEERLKQFGPFVFSGDFRLRAEPIFGGPANQSLDQDRERFRLRFNVTAKLDEDFAGGFSLASGDINDPTSTNQTDTAFYTRKAIAIDKAFVDYTPHQWHALTVVGGKFAYPWYNTELTWDKDLNPEGAAETLAWNFDSVPVLKKFAVVGFELPYAQVAKTSTVDQSLVTSIVYGGQIQTQWQLLPWLKFGAYSGLYDWHNADPIALALAKASSKNPQTPLTGLLPLGTGNTVQNSIVTTTATNVVTIGGTSYATGVTTVTNAQFASKFALFDNIARFDVSTPSNKWPIAFIGDYVQNLEACANVDDILAAPVNTATVHYTQTTNFPCNSHQRRGYWGETQVGRGQKKGDWQFDYTRMFIEREAVLSNFDYSDIRQGSNVTEHRAMVIYQLENNVQLSWTGLFGRPLNFGSTAPPEDFLKRLQFDVIYTF
jgi:putative porin